MTKIEYTKEQKEELKKEMSWLKTATNYVLIFLIPILLLSIFSIYLLTKKINFIIIIFTIILSCSSLSISIILLYTITFWKIVKNEKYLVYRTKCTNEKLITKKEENFLYVTEIEIEKEIEKDSACLTFNLKDRPSYKDKEVDVIINKKIKIIRFATLAKENITLN